MKMQSSLKSCLIGISFVCLFTLAVNAIIFPAGIIDLFAFKFVSDGLGKFVTYFYYFLFIGSMANVVFLVKSFLR